MALKNCLSIGLFDFVGRTVLAGLAGNFGAVDFQCPFLRINSNDAALSRARAPIPFDLSFFSVASHLTALQQELAFQQRNVFSVGFESKVENIANERNRPDQPIHAHVGEHPQNQTVANTKPLSAQNQ